MLPRAFLKMFRYFFLVVLLPYALTGSHSHFSCNTTFKAGKNGRNFAPGPFWDNAVVKYEFHANLNPGSDRQVVQEAFDEYHRKTCIRFEQRSPSDPYYTVIQLDENNGCGVGSICRTNGPGYVKVGRSCFSPDVFMHELGHNLCFLHEFERPDRDNFVSYQGCNPAEIPEKVDPGFPLIRGHFYDYTSQMHYQCGFCGMGGWPKMQGIVGCGFDVNKGLSVMDADKFNDIYDCGGCLRHRWRRYEDFSEADRQNAPVFGQTPQGGPIYLCRAYVNGEMTPGKYRFDQNVCYLGSKGIEIGVSGEVQIYTILNAKVSRGALRQEQGQYTLFPVNPSISAKRYDQSNFISVGSTPLAETIYAATATITWNGLTEKSLGKVYAHDLTKAYVPFAGGEFEVTTFSIIGCQ